MWLLYATFASVFWGITYSLNEQLYKHISIFSSFVLISALSTVAFTIIALANGTFQKDMSTLASNNLALILIVSSASAFILAEVFIGLSITGKNATLAGLIEISYPIFIILFSYLIFRESHLNLGTLLGGALVFFGIASIYLFNR